MTDPKYWWQSRTIWLQLEALLFAVLGTFRALPAGLDQDQVVTVIMAFVSVATIIFRLGTTRAID